MVLCLGTQVANPAVVRAGTIAKQRFHLASLRRPEVFAGRADIAVVFDIEDEISHPRPKRVERFFFDRPANPALQQRRSSYYPQGAVA